MAKGIDAFLNDEYREVSYWGDGPKEYERATRGVRCSNCGDIDKDRKNIETFKRLKKNNGILYELKHMCEVCFDQNYFINEDDSLTEREPINPGDLVELDGEIYTFGKKYMI